MKELAIETLERRSRGLKREAEEVETAVVCFIYFDIPVRYPWTDLRRHERQLEELTKRHTKIFREYRQSCENQKVRFITCMTLLDDVDVT